MHRLGSASLPAIVSKQSGAIWIPCRESHFGCWLNQYQDSQSEIHSEDSLMRGSEELRRAWITLQRVERWGEASSRVEREFMDRPRRAFGSDMVGVILQ